MAGGETVTIGRSDKDRQADRPLPFQAVFQQQIEGQFDGEGEQRQSHQLPLCLPLPPEQGGQHSVKRAIAGAGNEATHPCLLPVVAVKQADPAHLQVPLLDLVHIPSFPEFCLQSKKAG